MDARLLLVPLLFMTTAFAGCFGGDAGNDVEGATTDDPSLNTSAPDGRRILAFEETNLTEDGKDGVDHHHDYWQGRERVLVFEREAMMSPFPNPGGVAATFRPPMSRETPTLVYEGTETVEFTISNPRRHACEPLVTFGGRFMCTDYLVYADSPVPAVEDPTGGPSGLTLRFKHASTTEWVDAGPIAWNTPAIIKITDPVQTDMPHATSSAWEFQVRSPHAEDATLVFDAKVEIARAPGDVIALWPPHPLFYTEEQPHRVVVNDVMAAACDSGFSGSGCILADGTDPVAPEKLLSYGTRTLFVWVNITEFTPGNPAAQPQSWFLYHNNVTGETNITATDQLDKYGIEKRELFWALPVDDGGMDSPYADGSKWSFQLGASYVPPDNPLVTSCYGGCAEWTAKYTLRVVASSVELSPSEYHMSCLNRDNHCPQPDGSERRR